MRILNLSEFYNCIYSFLIVCMTHLVPLAKSNVKKLATKTFSTSEDIADLQLYYEMKAHHRFLLLFLVSVALRAV